MHQMNTCAIVSLCVCLVSHCPSAAVLATEGPEPDDTSALQRQVDAAISMRKPVVLQSRVYRISSSIVVASRRANSVLGLTIQGAGVGNTVIVWGGSPEKSVFVIKGAKYGTVAGLYFKGTRALADLDFAGNGSSSNMKISTVYFENPATFSVRLGNPQDFSEVSEFSFESVASANATSAGFEIEGNNSLNENFYNCGCSHEPACVSNSPLLDPAAQAGGNFNWFGGSVSSTPDRTSDARHATFLLSNGATYNFIGVRVENSSTLFYTSNSSARVMVNWIGGMWYDWMAEESNNEIIVLADAGSFRSTNSVWMGKGSFYFGPHTISNEFEGDDFRLGKTGQVLNESSRNYFARVPKEAPLRLVDIRAERF